MGLKCLLGHDFADPEIEREQREDGNEVVVTLREVQTCRRCGEQRIVSENKEVTSVEQLSAAAEGETVPSSAQAHATDETDDRRKPTAGRIEDSTPETIDDDGGRTPGGKSDAEPEGVGSAIDRAPGDESRVEPPGETEPGEREYPEDDAEILTSGPEDDPDPSQDAPAVSEPQDVPAVSEAEPSRTDSPEPAGGDDPKATIDDDPADDAPQEDDGIVLSPSGTEPDRAPGEWPEHEPRGEIESGTQTPWPEQQPHEEPDEETDAEPVGEGDTAVGDADRIADEDVDFTRVGAVIPPGESTDDVPTEFFCPECGIAQRAGQSSMRSGDICPECKRGYIAERALHPR